MEIDRNTTAGQTALMLVCGSLLYAQSASADVPPDYRIGSFGVQSPFLDEADATDAPGEHRTEMLFKLSPAVDPLSESEEPAGFRSEISLNRIDFLKPGEARMQDVHHGFSYSASIDIEPEDEFHSESRLISSKQLGIHYGRLGSVNYSGVDLSFRQFDGIDAVSTEDDKELWSLGVTTGRRFSMTGLDPSDPLWTVSLRGQFNFVEQDDDSIEVGDQQWYLSPGLHWQRDNFLLSADVLMPFMQSGGYETETDYRIRANIQKRF
ncbi:MAG: hypothetical protein AAF404_14845 [Pseudomonadota bacterium]